MGGAPQLLGQRYIERMDSVFHEKALVDKETGQAFTYNKVSGVLVTGNEDGAHSVVTHLVWALHEQGLSIPANAHAYWVGEAGPFRLIHSGCRPLR